MQRCVTQLGTAAAVAVAAAAGLHFLGFSPWSPDAHATLVEFAAIVATVALCGLIDPSQSTTSPGNTVRLSFIADLTTLVFFGPVAMTLVAVIGAVARLVADPPDTYPVRRSLLHVLAAGVAAQTAASIYTGLGGTTVPLAWPWQGIPMAGAALTYCVFTSAIADLVTPVAIGGSMSRAWPRHVLSGCPGYVIGAGIAIGVIELIQRQAWPLLPLAAVPFFFAWNAFRSHTAQLGRQDRRLDVTASPDHGVCLLDDDGYIREWNDALALLVDCPALRAKGRRLADAIPKLAATHLPVAVQHALGTRTTRTLTQVPFGSVGGPRLLNVTILPDADGLMLLWLDVTGPAMAEQALRETAERFALAAEGANDGIWELDVSTRTMFVSTRWREMLGLSRGEGRVDPDEWFDRVHPDDVAGLRKAIESLTDGLAGRIEFEHRLRHEDGAYRSALCCAVVSKVAKRGSVRIAGSLTDITASAIARDLVLNAGSRDPLTALLNRAAFVDKLGQRLGDYRERRRGRFASLYLDLDRFKVVNDSLGHLIGDDLLVAVARRFEAVLRPGDAIARLGGDEFAIMLENIGDEMQANVVAFRLQEALQPPFQIGGREVVTSASIGIAISRPEYTSPEEIMRDADTAMYRAKAGGKARHELFDAEMHARASDRLGLENDLRQAVKTNAFEVHYQPIVSLATRMCTGFESLVRWNRNGAAVSPADFVPVAEELGIIDPIGTWVLQQACRKFVEWKERFPACELDCITVNVSARQLVKQGFIYLVEQTLDENRMRPQDLRLEITETAIMDAPRFAAKVLAELREFGVKIYLDDFGTGYSSLSHLHKLPVDALKIDRSFVMELLMDDRPAMVESILALARTLQVKVVAEGVEDERQATELERLGCRQAQGYYFSRPIPAHKIEALLTARQPLGGTRTPAVDRGSLLKAV